jgi:hypothetical protein
MRQFGYSSTVPGRFGWRTSPIASYGDAATSRLGVAARNACSARISSSSVGSGPISPSPRSSASNFSRSAAASARSSASGRVSWSSDARTPTCAPVR